MRNRQIATMMRGASRFFVVILLALAAVTPVKSGNVSQPFSLTIRPLRDSATVGSQLRVEVVLKNTSDHEIGILESAPEADYAVEVRDVNGNMPPDTDFGRKQKDPSSVKVSTATPLYPLKPGKTLRDEIRIDKLYEMTAVGKYSIQVSRAVPEEMGGGVVRSNTITITMFP